MRVLVTLAILTLAACGGNGPTSPTTSDPAPTGILSPSGYFMVSGQATARSGAIVEQRWAEVQACAGRQVSVHGISFVMEPYVIVADGGAGISMPDGSLSGGEFITATSTIRVVGSDDWSITWRHELIHLWLNRTTGDADGKHLSPLFGKCGQ